jgi:hypothetical protein
MAKAPGFSLSLRYHHRAAEEEQQHPGEQFPYLFFFGSLMDSLEGKHTSPSLHRPNLINNRVNHESPPPFIKIYLNAVAVREVKRQLLSRLADYYDTALHNIHV